MHAMRQAVALKQHHLHSCKQQHDGLQPLQLYKYRLEIALGPVPAMPQTAPQANFGKKDHVLLQANLGKKSHVLPCSKS